MSAKIRTAIISLAVLMGSVAACGEAGATITRLAVGDPGPDAYTLVSDTDDADVTRRAEAGGEKDGNEPGLYGGTRKVAACDKDGLVKFLQANPDKAKAWASALSIQPSDIPGFVGDLTPALLRVDTFVTNHGYRDGRATAMPAVLQAGVGVLVDKHGQPVVKCNCGNPLTAPDEKINIQNSDFKGDQWPQFKKDKVTVIEPHEEEVKTLELVDSDMGMAFDRPVGTEGGVDGAPEPIPPSAMPEPDPTRDPTKDVTRLPRTLRPTPGPGTSGPEETGEVTEKPTNDEPGQEPQSVETSKAVLPPEEPAGEQPPKEPPAEVEEEAKPAPSAEGEPPVAEPGPTVT